MTRPEGVSRLEWLTREWQATATQKTQIFSRLRRAGFNIDKPTMQGADVLLAAAIVLDVLANEANQ